MQSHHTLEEEITSVEEFLASRTSGPEEDLTWECSTDPNADTRIVVPRTLVRSFVEHALLNDVSKHPEGGKIEVSVHRTNLGILIMVTDNGSLRYQEYNLGRLIGNRLELLDQEINEFNKEKEYSINYQLLDLAYAEPGQTGTRVLITIKTPA